MVDYTLSILIPTVVGREQELQRLLDCISEQLTDEYRPYVSVEVCKDNKEKSIGAKRDFMYNDTKGIYSVMIDDDDLIAPDFIPLVLEAAFTNPDCITYEERVDIDEKLYYSNFRADYSDWDGDGSVLLSDGFHFHRTPFFKCPIKTELCRQVGVADMRYAEDIDFARRIKPLLKSEYHIAKQLYYYIHRSSDFNERYGFDKQ